MTILKEKKKSFLNKNIALMFSALISSSLGDIFYSVAIGFWVYQTTGSVSLMSIMASIGMFVNVVLNPIGGVIVDKLHRKKLMIFGDGVQAILMLIVGFLALNNHLSVPVILVSAFIVSVAGSFYSPAVMTVMIDLVDKSQLVQSQSSFSGLNNFIRLIGKGLSGYLTITLGVPLMIIFNGLCNLLAALLIFFMKIPVKHDVHTNITLVSVFKDLKEGAILSFSMKGLNLLFICAILTNYFGAGFQALLIPISFIKGLSETQYGLFTMSNTAAVILASLFLSVIKIEAKHKLKLFTISFIFQSLFSVFAFMSFGFLPFTSFFFISELFGMIGNTLLSTSLMLAAPESKRATIFGFLSSFSIAGTALSTLVYGSLSTYFDLMLICIVGTILGLITLSPLFFSPYYKKIMLVNE